MTLAAFLEHWSMFENPFKGEEARQDPVLTRLSAIPDGTPVARPVAGIPRPGSRVQHPDFEKIVGDFSRPATAIVFGEKGSGKTAIRLQLAEHLAAYNAEHPKAQILLVPYDSLNELLDRYIARVLPTMKDKKATPADALKTIRLVDHLDGMLGQVVPHLIDAVLEVPARPADKASLIELRPGPEGLKRKLRALDRGLKRDLLILQAVYDRDATAEERTIALRRRLGLRRSWLVYVDAALAYFGWLMPLGVAALFWLYTNREPEPVWYTSFFIALGIWLFFMLRRIWISRFVLGLAARRLRKQLRTLDRSEASYLDTLDQLPASCRGHQILPLTSSDDRRYAMIDRLKRVLAPFGYSGAVVVVDRLDEPTSIAGDPERMRSVAWPLLNNKFLQQEAIGVKLLLPIELRHLLFRESSAFFQEARLDKQNLIERLAWTGAMLYDLCTARLNACRPAGAQPVSLKDLFGEDVTREDLVDTLDQMHQPRDVFKLLYQCMSEHCSNTTSDQASFRIPKPVLDMVRKQQTERMRQLYMGVRPA